MLNSITRLTILAQADSFEQLESSAGWWTRLGNVLFGGVIVLLALSVLLTFWRRHANKQKELAAKKDKVDAILAEDMEAVS